MFENLTCIMKIIASSSKKTMCAIDVSDYYLNFLSQNFHHRSADSQTDILDRVNNDNNNKLNKNNNNNYKNLAHL